jgi:hypothetical protein
VDDPTLAERGSASNGMGAATTTNDEKEAANRRVVHLDWHVVHNVDARSEKSAAKVLNVRTGESTNAIFAILLTSND